MKRLTTKLCLAAAACAAATNSGIAAQYQDTVKALNPTFYYELNETTTASGAVDSMGRGPVGSYNGDYAGGGPEVGIAGPDFLLEGGAWTVSSEWSDIGDQIDLVGLGAGNRAHASNNAGHISLGTAGDRDKFGANAMTVSLFALGGPAAGGDRIFTNNLADPMTSFQIVVGNDGIVVSTNPTLECPNEEDCGHRSLFLPGEGVPNTNGTADRGLNDANNGWWHIVASTSGSTPEERTQNIRLLLNGVDRTEDMLPGTTGWGTNDEPAKIGGRRADPNDSTTHSGAQDEVAIWIDRALTNAEALSLYNAAVGLNVPVRGDFNGNGSLDVADINDLSSKSAGGTNPAAYDLSGDAAVNEADLKVWIRDLYKSYVGDANVDKEFNSADLVQVLAAGKYETGAASVWAEGDFNGDGRTDSSDLVSALSDGGYEQGVRPAVAAVPEPAMGVASVLGLALLAIRRRRS